MTEKNQEKPVREFKFLPLTVGLETKGGIFTPIVLRGTPLPAKRQQTSTASDNQAAVDIRLYIGERPIAKKNQELTQLLLKDIPKAPMGVPQVSLIMEIAKNLSIKAKAVELESKGEISVDFHEGLTDLTEDRINQILQDAEENKANDQNELRRKEVQVKAENLIYQAENFLRDESKAKMYDSDMIGKILAELGLAIQNDNPEEIRTKTTLLENQLKSPKIGGFDDIFKDFNFNIFGTQPRASRTTKLRPAPSHKPPQNKVPKAAARDEGLSAGPVKYDIGKIFGGIYFTPDPNLCFVLMPFLSEMAPIYTDHIKPVVESEGISCQRADEIVGTNLITYDIWEKINRARFIVADLTGRNPNVFYEIGLAHALGKEVVLITQSMDDVPFDLKALRCVVYSFTPRGMKELEDKLVNTIRQIMSSSS
jgi:hypothetical protein